MRAPGPATCSQAIFKENNLQATADQVEVERRKFMHAPLVIGVVSRAKPHVKIPLWEQELSAGASVMNIVTAANALGYVANWLTGWVAFDRAAHGCAGARSRRKDRRLRAHRPHAEGRRGSRPAAAVQHRHAVLGTSNPTMCTALLVIDMQQGSLAGPTAALTTSTGW